MSPFESIPPLPCPADEIDAFLATPKHETLESLREVEGDILVLGAGGKMGLHLCLMLQRSLKTLGKRSRVIAASRFASLNDSEAYEAAGIETLRGDFRNDDFVESLPLCPTVFYLVGAKFGTSDDSSLLWEINVEVASRLSYRFRESKIVAFSTGCVYSYVKPSSGGSKENGLMNPVGEYAKSCLGRERRFEEISQTYGTSVVLIRLNYSVEFRYGVLLDIGQKAMSGETIDPSMGYVNVIWQNDALNQIVQCLSLASSPAMPINIAGPEVIPVRELALRFANHFGVAPNFEGEEAETAWLSDASRSHELFGRPSVDLNTMIEWVVAWLKSGGETHGKPTGFEKRDGKF